MDGSEKANTRMYSHKVASWGTSPIPLPQIFNLTFARWSKLVLENLTFVVVIANVTVYNIMTRIAKEELLWQISMKGSKS